MINKLLPLLFILYCIECFGINKIVGTFYGQKIDDFSELVSISFNKNRLYVLDYIYGKAVCFENNKIKFVVEGLKNPSFISTSKDKLYITENLYNTINFYNLETGKKMGSFGSYGMAQKEFKNPSEVYSNENYIYIPDNLNFRIQVLDNNHNYIKQLLLPRFNYLYNPYYSSNYSLAFNDNKIYVLDNYNKKVYVFSNDELEDTIEINSVKIPTKIFYNNNNIYIHDNYENIIHKFNLNFELIEKIKTNVKSNVSITNFNKITMEQDNFFFINKREILKFSLKDKKLETFKNFFTTSDDCYVYPIDIKTDKDDNLYILDKELSKVFVFDKNLTYIKSYSDLGYEPTSIFVDYNKNLFVAVSGENKIKKFNSAGKLIYEYGDYKTFFSNFNHYLQSIPENERSSLKLKENIYKGKIYNLKIALDEKGYIYVLNNFELTIKYYDSFFNFIGSFGKPASIKSVFKNEKEPKSFGWDELNYNTLTDFFIIKNKIFVLDNFYKRINVYEKNEDSKIFSTAPSYSFKNFFEYPFIKNLNSIYADDKEFYLVDSENFKIFLFNDKWEKINEISFLNEGQTPLAYNNGFVIVKEHKNNFQVFYKVLKIK